MDKEEDSGEIVFKVALALQRPVLDPCVAVGFLPFSSDCLRVGQLVNVRWRIERLKNPESDASSSCGVRMLIS
jgi:trafficking protein particle complex subunit 10